MARKFPAPKGSRWFHKEIDGVITENRIDPDDPEPDHTWTRGHKPKSEHTRKLMSDIHTGRVMTPIWKERMSLASKGKPKSEAHKQAMSAAMKARHATKKGNI